MLLPGAPVPLCFLRLDRATETGERHIVEGDDVANSMTCRDRSAQ